MAVLGAFLFCCDSAYAQSDDADNGRGAHKGGRHGEHAALTDAQKETMKSILADYNPSALTAADAKAIHQAFRDAGIRPGPGFREAIAAAGFDPEALRQLDPPPERRGGDGHGGRRHDKKQDAE